MSFKHLFSIGLIFLISNISVFSQEAKKGLEKSGDENIEMDTTLVVPDDFDNTLDYLLHSWVVQRAGVSNCESSEIPPPVSDSICKLRLSKLPYIMEMPYNSTIRSFIDLYTVRKRTQLEYMLGMSEYYFPLFEQVLGANNLPLELKYLAIIESALNTTVVSRMGAAGLWQMMIGTGRTVSYTHLTLPTNREV